MKTPLILKGLLPSCLVAVGIILTALPASAAMKHRYSFTTDAADSVGGKNGTLVNATASGGQVSIANPTFIGSGDPNGAHVVLPENLLTNFTAITIEAWMTPDSGDTWARLWDFGNRNDAGNGSHSFWLRTGDGTDATPLRGDIFYPGNGDQLNGTAIPTSSESHIVWTSDGTSQQGRLYVNGVLAGLNNTFDGTPALMGPTTNNWLGRSQFTADRYWNGSINEFRIHDNALSQLQVLASKTGGPNATNYTPEAATSIVLVVTSPMVVGTSQSPTLDAVFPTYGNIVIGASEGTLASSASGIVRVDAGGVLTAVAPGTATITASMNGLTNSASLTVVPPVVFTALKHRYSFNEAAGSATATDSVGGANFLGNVIPPLGTAAPVVISNGMANFPGGAFGTAGYIDLPDGMLSGKGSGTPGFTNLTVEFWFTWNGPAGDNWQRVFDFGNSLKANNDPRANGNGLGYVLFTTRRGAVGARTEFRATADAVETGASAFVSVNNDPAGAFPTGREVHVVTTVAPGIGYSAVYFDGVLVNIGSTPLVGTPPTRKQFKDMSDPNMWLGVSQWQDSPLNGNLNEFRIHEGVLDEVKIALSRKAGPNALPVANPGTLTNTSLQTPALYVGNPATTQASLIGDYQNVTGVEITGFNGVQLRSTDTNVFTVSATGAMTPRAVGTASLIANYQTFSTTSAVAVLAPVSLSVTNLPATVDAGSVNITASLFANFANGTSNLNVSGFNGVTRSSSDTTVATVTGAGVITVRNPGTTVITSTYGGLTNQATLTVVTPAGFTRGTLVNRWSFGEAKDATTANDSVGGKHGEVRNIQGGALNENFTGTGQLSMGPGTSVAGIESTNAYVNLPNGLISSLSSLTIEGWFTWRGGANNQHLFDFGMSSGLPDGSGGTASTNFLEDVVISPGRNLFFLSPQTGNPRFGLDPDIGGAGTPETPNITSSVAITVSNLSHFAIVYDQPRGVARLYINGLRAGTGAAPFPLSVVDDRNNWLGRSNWLDPMYNGTIDEFRIYSGPMLDSDIADSFAAGPSTLPVPRPKITVTSSASNIVLSWPVADSAGFVLKASGVLGAGQNFTNVNTPITVVGGNNQATLPSQSGQLFFRLEK